MAKDEVCMPVFYLLLEAEFLRSRPEGVPYRRVADKDKPTIFEASGEIFFSILVHHTSQRLPVLVCAVEPLPTSQQPFTFMWIGSVCLTRQQILTLIPSGFCRKSVVSPCQKCRCKAKTTTTKKSREQLRSMPSSKLGHERRKWRGQRITVDGDSESRIESASRPCSLKLDETRVCSISVSLFDFSQTLGVEGYVMTTSYQVPYFRFHLRIRHWHHVSQHYSYLSSLCKGASFRPKLLSIRFGGICSTFRISQPYSVTIHIIMGCQCCFFILQSGGAEQLPEQ